MSTNHQCMALNRDMTARCPRRATKMLAPISRPSWYQDGMGTRDVLPPSLTTILLCGICNRSLHSGSRSLFLQVDDGTRHTVCGGRGIGEIYCTKDRGVT